MKKERYFKYLGTSNSAYLNTYFDKGENYKFVRDSGGYYTLIDNVGDEYDVEPKDFKEVTDEDVENVELSERIKALQKELEELKLLNETKRLKKELKKGKWYTRKSGTLICLTEIDDDGVINGYGFDCYGDYHDEAPWGARLEDWKLADTRKVEKYLIEEAIKRGFKKGGTIESLGNYTCEDKLEHLTRNIEGATLYTEDEIGYSLQCGCELFRNGKWAKIVKNSLPEINGYEGIDKGTYIKYGCAKVAKSLFEETDLNRNIATFTLDSGVTFPAKDVKRIREYLKHN